MTATVRGAAVAVAFALVLAVLQVLPRLLFATGDTSAATAPPAREAQMTAPNSTPSTPSAAEPTVDGAGASGATAVPRWDAARFTKPSAAELRSLLTPLQYKVTQEDGTEPPFNNEYWDNHADGIYVDVVSGEPLFSSRDKYDSGTGWPSFSQPLPGVKLKTKTDLKAIWPRTEVRSPLADSHLGHVFHDGPAPTGLRYCINSAALRFVPKEQMAAEGYGYLLHLFD